MNRTNRSNVIQNEREEEKMNYENDAASNNNSGDEREKTEEEKKKDEPQKKKRVQNNRVVFKPDHLVNPDKGLKKLYEWTNKLKLDTFDNKKEVIILLKFFFLQIRLSY